MKKESFLSAIFADPKILGFIILLAACAFLFFGIIKPIKSRGFKAGDIFMTIVALVFFAISLSLLLNLTLLP